MPEAVSLSDYVVSRFDDTQNIFYLKSKDEEVEKIAVSCTINLQGMANGTERKVNTGLASHDYDVCRFINPYLNAQNDVFRIKTKVGKADKTIGYIFPASALEGDEETADDFDELKQAYKFYCIKNVVEQYNWTDYLGLPQPIDFSSIISPDNIYAIIHKPSLGGADFQLIDCLPNFALYGYYHFSNNSKPNVLSLTSFSGNRDDLNTVIKARFLQYRGQQNLAIKSSKNIVQESALIKLLYMQLLVESDNPLYRFLILYQVIEYLVDKHFKVGLNVVVTEKDKYSTYNFLQKIKELNNTRSTINKFFEDVTFDEKGEITSILKSFITEFDVEYEKSATGDCLYDMRNLLFHDYKSVLENNRDGELVSLVIQCELLIHRLVLALGSVPATEVEAVVAPVAVPVARGVPDVPARDAE